MSRDRAILLIVEGEKAEPRLMQRVFDVYGVKDATVYSYKANIYDLYKRMFEEGEDPDDRSLVLTLKEKERDPEKRSILDIDYSDTILIFDFDPQDHLFSVEKMSKMISYFDESTDQGKLYINYPMVEAYRDLLSMPYDRSYTDRIIELHELSAGTYKGIVDRRSKLPQLEDCNVNVFDQVLVQNIEKASLLVGVPFTETDPSRFYDALSQLAILEAQSTLLADHGVIGVLCTCLWFAIDYRPMAMRRYLVSAASRGWDYLALSRCGGPYLRHIRGRLRSFHTVQASLGK